MRRRQRAHVEREPRPPRDSRLRASRCLCAGSLPRATCFPLLLLQFHFRSWGRGKVSTPQERPPAMPVVMRYKNKYFETLQQTWPTLQQSSCPSSKRPHRTSTKSARTKRASSAWSREWSCLPDLSGASGSSSVTMFGPPVPLSRAAKVFSQATVESVKYCNCLIIDSSI